MPEPLPLPRARASEQPRRRGLPRRVDRTLVVGVGLVLVVLYLLLLAVEGGLAARAAVRARADQADVVRALSNSDLPAAQRSVQRLAGETSRARTLLAGPQWVLPEALPVVGDDVRAVRVSVRALDDVVRRAALPVVQAAGSLRGPGGRLDIAALPRIEPVLSRAADEAAAAERTVGAIRPAGLIAQLRAPVVQAQQGVARLALLTGRARDGLRLADALLGVRGPSSTLLGVQNPAEVRAAGGIVGAWATLRGQGGRLSITSTGVNDTLFAHFAAADLVPPEVLATYGQDIRNVANVTMTPNFPLAARLLLSSYQGYARATPTAAQLPTGTNVVTLTPQGLGLLIGATRPVQIPAQKLTVTAGNAADVFENTIYTLVPDDGVRIGVVQQVLREVFGSLQAPATDPLTLAKALGVAVASGDLRVWSPDPQVQAAADRLGAAGTLAPPDGSATRVTLVSADAAKLDFYVHEQVVLDRAARTLTVSLQNRAPAVVAPYVAVHNAEPGEPATGHDLVVQVHLPPGVGVDTVELDGHRVGFATGTESGWRVLRAGVRVRRGDTAQLRVRLTGAAPKLRQVFTQPLCNLPSVVVK